MNTIEHAQRPARSRSAKKRLSRSRARRSGPDSLRRSRSSDMGGWREIIEPAALRATKLGYTPNLILLTPAASEAIDVMVSGLTGGSADFVFGPAQFAPGTLFGIPRVESKVLAAPVVMDTRAHDALYLSPLSLARFEENAGRTNSSLIRLEGHAAIRHRADGGSDQDRRELVPAPLAGEADPRASSETLRRSGGAYQGPCHAGTRRLTGASYRP